MECVLISRNCSGEFSIFQDEGAAGGPGVPGSGPKATVRAPGELALHAAAC